MAPKQPPPNRSTDATIFVRCDSAEKEFIEEAGAAEAEKVKEQTRSNLPLYAYALQGILERAERDLGIKYKDWLKARENKGKKG